MEEGWIEREEGKRRNLQENPVQNANALEKLAAAHHSVWAAHS